MSWRTSVLLREAWLNVVANRVRSLVLVALVGSTVAILAFLELREAADLSHFRAAFTAAGGYVVVVSNPGGSIDAGRCHALNGRAGISSAGAMRIEGATSLNSAPDIPFQSAAVTDGMLAIWAGTPNSLTGGSAGAGYLVGAALAAELGLKRLNFVAIPGTSPSPILGVLDTNRRSPPAQRWLLEIAPPIGSFDECWVEFERSAYAPGSTSLAAWFAADSNDPLVRPYIRSGQFTRDTAREFSSRPQRWGWLVAGALMGALFLLASWFRRSELGLYLAVGTSRLQLLQLVLFEATLLLGFATCAGLAWALSLSVALGQALPADHVGLALRSGVSALLLGIALSPWLGSLVASGSIAGLLKDR